jgi:hypothetical protein
MKRIKPIILAMGMFFISIPVVILIITLIAKLFWTLIKFSWSLI